MNISYMPILKALPSEIKALSKLEEKDFNGLCPLMDFPLVKDPLKEKLPAKFKDSIALIEDQLVDMCERLSDVVENKFVMVDNYRWQPDDQIETGELVISKIIHTLLECNVKVIPVIGYDRWDNEQYRQFYKTIHFKDIPFYSIRLDKTALEESGDPIHFLGIINNILEELALSPENIVMVIDAGSVFSLSEDDLFDEFENVINLLAKNGFVNFITAGCSMPATIDKAAKKDQTNILPRKEMTCWQYLRRTYTHLNITYGDYGVRSAESAEGPKGIGGNANAKIRYTIDKAFYIVRGHMVKGEGIKKEKQIWGLAKKIIDSPYYMSEDYSFGDKQIKLCADKKVTGGHPEWIVNDTTHHITYCQDEIYSYEVSIGKQVFSQ